ncbi:SpaA isopeptide-forming pilin-related protein [uncultured Microbacterium sp.]|uniref:SpaA isopeptide-forming pilin-related protein n=1 Tax=uncultured Microbacterium sp. TaxID=191216 RepID=UPI00262264E2|nr:SpaA isopeptide-forming pilin-related protein [uncultured Microbacterium sp.]
MSRRTYNLFVGVLCGALLFAGMPPTISSAETFIPTPDAAVIEGDALPDSESVGSVSPPADEPEPDAAAIAAEPEAIETPDTESSEVAEAVDDVDAPIVSTESGDVNANSDAEPVVNDGTPTEEAAGPSVARLAAGATYCSAPGVYSLDTPAAATSVRSLLLEGAGSDAVTGTIGNQAGALAISPDGSGAWSVARVADQLSIYRLAATGDIASSVYSANIGNVANLGTPVLAAMTRISGVDYLYFGNFTRTFLGQVHLELFAYNVTADSWIGQVSRVTLFTSDQISAGAGGDIAFDAQGNLLILWSHANSGTSSRLYQLAANSVRTTAGTTGFTATVRTVAIGTTTNQPWSGLAYDSSGNLWVSRASTADPPTSTLAIVNATTGALTSTATKSGYAITDLASCGSVPPTLTLQKNLPIGRLNSGDQFTLDVRLSGSGANLASVTTTGAAAGTQTPAVGPLSVTAGAVYTIAETGASGASLADYILGYGCTWANGDIFVAAGATLSVNSGRAQATLPPIPSGRNAQALTCTITNVAKAVALTLEASLTSARFAATDQFTLDIRQSGSQTNLSQATTTTSAATGPQAPAAGPLNVVAGAVYTIAQTGAAGASLGAYTFTYGCVWADGSTFVAAGSSLTYNINTGRASATLPGIPTDRDGQALACTVVNTAKNAADVPPRLDLQKNIASRTAGHQFHLAVNRTFDNALLTENTTTGTTNGLQTATVARTTAEQGVTYTISEGAAGSAGTLLGYAASFACTWSGGGELARGVLSVGANGRLQSMLPAIPAGYNGQVLTCTITNQLTPPQALDCSVDSVYALHRTTAGQYAKRVTSSGMSTGTTVPNRVSFGTTDNQNALAVNLDGSAAIAVTQAPNGSGQLVMRKWTAALGNGTPTASILTRTGATTPATPSDFVGGAIDPTTGDYYFGGYSGSNFRLFVVRADASTFQFVRNISIPGAGTGNANGDITFDASGNLYLVWSLGTTHVLARLDAGKVNSNGDAVRIAFLASNDTFNGITFNGRGELFASGGFGIKRLDPSTGQPMGGTNGNGIVDTTTGVVDLASCGLPPTMRLQKEVDGRVVSTDQFGLEIRADGAGTGIDDVVVQSATTAGSTTGIQTQYAGSMVVTVGKSYVIREVGAPADLNRYIASYSCQWSDDTAPSDAAVLSPSGAARQASVGPIPSAADLGTARGKAGQQLVCTITNTPVFDATVVATKTILDPSGANPTPGVGWAITSTRLTTSTAGTTISTPATKTTISGGAVPTPWTVGIPNSSAFVNLQVAEAQQPGHDLVPGTGSGSSLAGSYCTVTPPIGQPRTVLITATTVQVSGVKAGDRVECSFVNRQRAGSVTWQKVDAASTTTFLSGAEWALTGPNVPAGTIVVDCIAASDSLCAGSGTYVDRDARAGHFRITQLLHGTYSLTESKAPAGFIRSDEVHTFIISPSALDYSFAASFENERIPMPEIPLTGGTARDAFVIAGGMLIGLALLGAWIHRRRRPRDSPI